MESNTQKRPSLALKIAMIFPSYLLVYTCIILLTIILAKLNVNALKYFFNLSLVGVVIGGLGLLAILIFFVKDKKNIKLFQSVTLTYWLRKYLKKTENVQVLSLDGKTQRVTPNEEKIKNFNYWRRFTYIEVTEVTATLYLRKPWTEEVETMLIPEMRQLRKRVTTRLSNYYFSDFDETTSRDYILLEGQK